MITFDDFVKKYNLKNEATSNMRIHQVLSSLSLDDVGVFLRSGPFISNIGIVNLHRSKGTHWVCYINENCFDVPPKNVSKFFIKRKGYRLFSENQIQKTDSFCARYCLFRLYLTKVLAIDFKSVVLNLNYQRIS